MKVEKRTKKIENDERKKKYMSDIDNKEEKKAKKGNKVVKGILIALIIIILLMIFVNLPGKNKKKPVDDNTGLYRIKYLKYNKLR